MGYNKQLNDSYRIVYTDTGSTALPDIHTFDHTGVYSLIAKPSQLGKTVTIGFSVVSGGKTTNTTLAEGNYFVEYSELASNIYWNFSFLGKANSGSDFTAQNTMVTYNKSKGTYTVKTDELSGGGGDVPTPAVYVTKKVDFIMTATNTDNATTKTLTAYVYSDGTYHAFGSLANKMKTKTGTNYVGQYKYDYTKFSITSFFVGGFSGASNGYWKGYYAPYISITSSGGYIQGIYVPATTSETPDTNSTFAIDIYGKYTGS